MFGLGNPNSSINVVLVGLSLVLRFVLVGNHPVEMAEIARLCTKLKASLPRRRKLRIGEGLARLREPETPF